MLDNLNRILSGEKYLQIHSAMTEYAHERNNRFTRATVSNFVGLLVLLIKASISFAIRLRFSMFIVVSILSACLITNEKRSAIPKEQSTRRTVGIVHFTDTNTFGSKSNLNGLVKI